MVNRAMWAPVAVLLAVALVAPQLARAADEDPLQDVCVADLTSATILNGFPCKPAAEVNGTDFVFTGFRKPGNTSNPNLAQVTPAFVQQFPGINTLGISAVRIDFAVGGINPPHTHPRATEFLILVEGTLYVGFVSSVGNNNTLFAATITAGDAFVFPRGLVHFQLNVGKAPALVYSGLDSQNPGVQQVAPALFASVPPISDEVLEKGFRIDEKTVDYIRSKFV